MSGIMQLVSNENVQNALLTDNPTKTFFYATYKQHTNFALQKFVLNFEGSKTLRLTEPSTFTFKVRRYADLLMDCYLSVELPNIWSPIFPPKQNPETGEYSDWVPYEFKWIDHIGAKMISKIQIVCGNYTIQEFSGDYLLAAAQRDFTKEKLDLFYTMIGHVPDMTDPSNAQNREDIYPNAYYTASNSYAGPDPSIRARTIYVPINAWFGLVSQMAFPLVALQNCELQIIVTIRPIKELFQIRDVANTVDGYPYVAPRFNSPDMQFYQFLHPPTETGIYTDTRSQWDTNIHLNCTYAFISGDEREYFAKTKLRYMYKQVHEYPFFNVTGANKVRLDSLGMVTGWLFYFQRSDANLRNEWSNYSNWPYTAVMPHNVIHAPVEGTFPVQTVDDAGEIVTVFIGPGINPDGSFTKLYTTPVFSHENQEHILASMGILLNGEYREDVFPVGIFNHIEKYTRTTGNAPTGLYCYHFGVNSNNANMQPSGSINMNIFNRIELEFTTNVPPIDPNAQSLMICDPDTGEPIGVNKATWKIYKYNYNLYLFEERINFVEFASGNCGPMFAT